jgi:predicted CoA-binding protein
MIPSRTAIDEFVKGRTLAMVGVSARGKGFGHSAYKELRSRGYRVLPVHPTATAIQGDPCWKSLAELPEPVERLLVVVSPDGAEAVVREAAAAGVRRVWLQQGAESEAALRAAAELGLDVVHGQCILMFADPVTSVHRFHRWLWGVFGKIPKRVDS